MTVKLVLEFDNIHQLTQFCAECAPHATHRRITDAMLPAEPAATEDGGYLPATLPPSLLAKSSDAPPSTFSFSSVPDTDPPVAKAKRGRKPKADTATVQAAANVVAAVVPAAAPVAAVINAAVTLKDAHATFRKLYDAKGLDTCIAVLQRYGLTRISELQEARAAEFAEHCERVLAGEDPTAAKPSAAG